VDSLTHSNPQGSWNSPMRMGFASDSWRLHQSWPIWGEFQEVSAVAQDDCQTRAWWSVLCSRTTRAATISIRCYEDQMSANWSSCPMHPAACAHDWCECSTLSASRLSPTTLEPPESYCDQAEVPQELGNYRYCQCRMGCPCSVNITFRNSAHMKSIKRHTMWMCRKHCSENKLDPSKDLELHPIHRSDKKPTTSSAACIG
jgi:hypothetical protein